MRESVDEPSHEPLLRRVCIGLAVWCAGLTVFAATVWIRTYVEQCDHERIFHHSSSSLGDCTALVSSGGVLRSASAFKELLLLMAVVAVPLFVIGPALLRSRRVRP